MWEKTKIQMYLSILILCGLYISLILFTSRQDNSEFNKDFDKLKIRLREAQIGDVIVYDNDVLDLLSRENSGNNVWYGFSKFSLNTDGVLKPTGRGYTIGWTTTDCIDCHNPRY